MARKNEFEVTKSTKKEIEKMQLDVSQVTRTRSLLNPNQIQKLWNRTPLRFQYEREGKAGQKWKYVRKGYVKRVLDSVFGFNWSFEVNPQDNLAMMLDVAEKTGVVVVRGALICIVVDDRGNEVGRLVKSDAGSVPVKFKKENNAVTGRKELLDFGNDVKGGYTDCLKRCAAQLGIAADVYDPAEFMDIEIVGSDEANERDKNLKRMINESKKTLKKQGATVEEGK